MQTKNLKAGAVYSKGTDRREIVGFCGDMIFFKVLSGSLPDTLVIWLDLSDDRDVYALDKSELAAWIGAAPMPHPLDVIPVIDGDHLRCGKTYWDGALRLRQIVALECREIPGPVTVAFRSLCGDEMLDAEAIDNAGRSEHLSSVERFLVYAKYEVNFGPEAFE